MTQHTDPSRLVSFRSEEIRQAEQELAEVEALLVEAELELATLKQHVGDFAKLYRHKCEGLCDELDSLKARIAALRTRHRRTSWDKEQSAYRKRPSHTDEEETSPPVDEPAFVPSECLKKLYRDAARLFHPDLSNGDDDDHAWRTQMMQQVNAAYAAGDSEALKRLLLQRRVLKKQGITADDALTTIRAKLARLRARLNEVLRERRSLETSDLGQLYLQAQKSALSHADFVRDLAVSLRAEIEAHQQILDDLIAGQAQDEH